MKFEELSQEDQMLVQTQFPAELEKQASAEIKMAQELYSAGFSKFATATAEALEKLAEEEKEPKEEEEKEHEKKLDEEQKKEASARGAFIARGYIDGLMKLGQENYGDEYAYLYPFIQEKMAGLEALKGMAGKAGKSVVGYGKDIAEHARRAATGTPAPKGAKANLILRPLAGKERAMEAGKAALKVGIPAAAAVGAAKAVGGKKEQ